MNHKKSTLKGAFFMIHIYIKTNFIFIIDELWHLVERSVFLIEVLLMHRY